MKKTLIALFGAFAGLSMTAGAMAADSFTIDSRHTFPVFEVNHLGFSTQRGRFNNVTGKIMLVPAQRRQPHQTLHWMIVLPETCTVPAP